MKMKKLEPLFIILTAVLILFSAVCFLYPAISNAVNERYKGSAGWFPPTDISGYTDTDAATAACYGDVAYVTYYYSGLGAEPSDITFNVIASGGQIYVVYA